MLHSFLLHHRNNQFSPSLVACSYAIALQSFCIFCECVSLSILFASFRIPFKNASTLQTDTHHMNPSTIPFLHTRLFTFFTAEKLFIFTFHSFSFYSPYVAFCKVISGAQEGVKSCLVVLWFYASNSSSHAKHVIRVHIMMSSPFPSWHFYYTR